MNTRFKLSNRFGALKKIKLDAVVYINMGLENRMRGNIKTLEKS